MTRPRRQKIGEGSPMNVWQVFTLVRLNFKLPVWMSGLTIRLFWQPCDTCLNFYGMWAWQWVTVQSEILAGIMTLFMDGLWGHVTHWKTFTEPTQVMPLISQDTFIPSCYPNASPIGYTLTQIYISKQSIYTSGISVIPNKRTFMVLGDDRLCNKL